MFESHYGYFDRKYCSLYFQWDSEASADTVNALIFQGIDAYLMAANLWSVRQYGVAVCELDSLHLRAMRREHPLVFSVGAPETEIFAPPF